MKETGAAYLLELMNNPITRVIPKGWKTLRQISKETGLKEARAGAILRDAMAEGKCERRKFQSESDPRPMYYYLLKK